MNRKKAFDEGIDTEAAIMWEIPMLAAVRSTNSLGGSPPPRFRKGHPCSFYRRYEL